MSDRPYIHPGDIPVNRALAVYHVMHGKDTVESWEILTSWVNESGVTKVLQDISRILDINGVKDPLVQSKELSWWNLLLKGKVI